jgi:hypothetical protein
MVVFANNRIPERHSYPERWRDRPCEASATGWGLEFNPVLTGWIADDLDQISRNPTHGANSGRRMFWQMGGQKEDFQLPFAAVEGNFL